MTEIYQLAVKVALMIFCAQYFAYFELLLVFGLLFFIIAISCIINGWNANGMRINLMFRTFHFNNISQALNCEDMVGLPVVCTSNVKIIQTFSSLLQRSPKILF